jgi:glycosyltransferase involved in cell wall biosynthesis
LPVERAQASDSARSRHLAIIGSVGIPNRYGGPEAFAESIAPVLAEWGFEVTVTCERSKYLDDLSPEFKGVRRIFIPVGANGATSPLHDLLAFLSVARVADYVLVLGVSGGIFFPIFRLVCALTGGRLLVNIDGVEWRRPKFGNLAKCVLYCSDWLAQRFAHIVIYDNEALWPYVGHPAKSVCVEYSGDHAVLRDVRTQSAQAAPCALTICRIEPENNCELLIEGFLGSSLPSYVFVGNWERSDYGRTLRRRYATEHRLQLLDPIYDPAELFRLRSSCGRYLHGHSVGGTNPSLVEMLFFYCEILCWDCAFNRSTAGAAARYFSSASQLAEMLSADAVQPPDRAAVRSRYSTRAIVEKLLGAFKRANPGLSDGVR